MTEPSRPSVRRPSRLATGLRRAVVGLTTLGLGAGLVLVGADAASAKPKHDHGAPGPASIALPIGFQPEGIAVKGTKVYSGSRATGDIYVADLRTGNGRVLSKGPGTPSLGLKVDGRRLWVAGGAAGDARVLDTRTGKVLASITLAQDVSTEKPSFVNDEVLAGRYVWFTDSVRPQLYRVDRRHPRRVTTVDLTGDWKQTAGTNANGIVRTPDGTALLVVKSDTGQLFRVDPRTGVATVVDLGGYALTAGDGLLLKGRTLYAVQNRLDKIAVVVLNQAGTRGELRRTITSPAFDVPSTVARAGKYLYLPNARFTATGEPATLAYSINRVKA
ncbi:YncE family protein [Microlunatus flavus]|uniref:Sugar lactone lactonase YvrE n=1 Tax=Microlunatus flavus TaxID=1036181 RepID=A0A1H9LPH1_9ACTN|nr:superoxide dismutase [Microlunatus flavus]SER13248.1 Sugar lactone lactonase YvrE [Microlunatus flavus]